MDSEALAKFKRIYAEEFGVELSDKEALEMATNFLNLMREVIKPIGAITDEYKYDSKEI